MLLFLLVVTTNGLWAQIPNGYYSNANGKSGDELKVALHDIIKGHTSISYSQIWNAFWSTDNKGNGVVWDMYSDIPNDTPPYTFSMGQNQCGEYSQEGDCYNREHSWPQSWFSGNDQATPSRDLHHVFPTDGFVNSQRSNYPYGEVNTASWTSQNGSKLGTCKSSLGYNGTVFEPIDEYKGDFARALMYMSVRYYDEDESWSTSEMTEKSVIKPWAITMLMDWSDNDPVSQKEINRNNVIYNDYQNNRNPFIDHPEYARMIWDPNWHESVGGYVKVTNADDITDGEYLIVYEAGNLAFDGNLTTLDAVGNTIAVTISGNTIESNATTDAAAFTIAAKTGGYSIKSASGYYIGNTSDANILKTSQNDDYVNTISITDGSADIVSSSSHLRYNSASNQTRFRYYKSGTYTSQQAIQLYKKIAVYSINLASVEYGSISADVEQAVEGTTITLTATPETGYELDHWTVTDAQNTSVAVTNNQFVMPASNVTVSAVFTYVGVFEQKYYLVTDASQLVAGRTYLVVNTEFGKAMGRTQNSNNRPATSVTIDNEAIADLGAACEFTLGGQTGAWTLYDASNKSGYLYAAGGSGNNNYLRTQATLTDAGKWTISLDVNGVATIKTIDSNVSRHTIMYNNSSALFSCYASGQKGVCLFIRSEEYDHSATETIANLFWFDKHKVRSGATLTVSGTASCNDAAHLVLEDGAQLVHQSENVQATVKRIIKAYTADGGWYTIATPFASSTPDGTMLSDAYDLYAYNECGDSQGKEWMNYKAGSFNLTSGNGYLYAHNPTITLRMTGTLKIGNYSPTVVLSYANNDADIKGFNLLGNPTAHEITFTKSAGVSDGYYYLDNSENWVYETGNTVPMGRGFLVKANAANQTVTLNPQSKANAADEGRYLCVSIGEEKAFVKLDEGVSMPLLDMMGKHSALYLTRDGKPYTMLVRDGATAVDISFEVGRNGSHLLKVDGGSHMLDYLHLIDHKTGSDINLLSGSGYAFETQSGDYASRFQLCFAPRDENADDEPFAFVSNGEIVFYSDQSGATLQVIDMTGRVVLLADATNRVSTNGIPAGVYVLRLIDGDSVRTQKMVIE